jgi:hypothetical protein
VVSATLLKKKKKKREKKKGGRSTHRGWLATPRPWGWLGHHQTGLVVAEPPQWPKGVVSATQKKKKKKKNMKEEEGGGFGHMGVARPPPDLPVWWWLSHPHGLGVASHPLWVDRPPFFFSLFFFFSLTRWPKPPP